MKYLKSCLRTRSLLDTTILLIFILVMELEIGYWKTDEICIPQFQYDQTL